MRRTDRRSTAAAGLLAALLAFTGPAAAQSDGGDGGDQGGQSAEDMAREGVERLMNALETFLGSIPQYGVPRIDEDGNIVIPRLDSPDGDDTPETPEKGGPDAPAGEGEDGPVETRI